MNTENKFLVSAGGGKILVLAPPYSMTKEEALLHAAWLVALAEKEEGQFAKVLDAVQSL